MKLTEVQQASLVISLSTLGQRDVSDNDPDVLSTLEYLLEQALENVRRAIGQQTGHEEEPRDFVIESHERIAHKNDHEAPDWEA